MQVFVWLALLLTVCVAVFAIQNSPLPLMTMKFLVWQVETSPVYAMLGSLVAGMLIMFLVWAPVSLKASFAKRSLKREIDNLSAAARREEEKKRAPSDVRQEDA
jgi:uncharacterized integral membrane protein